MRYILFSLMILGLIGLNQSCKKDDDDSGHEYHAHIHSPNTDARHIGDTLAIEVDFEDHNGGTVHHIEVTITNKADGTQVYLMPTEPHVHATSGSYTFEDTFILSEANGITADSDWILQARVWGETDGEDEESETVEFHVHP